MRCGSIHGTLAPSGSSSTATRRIGNLQDRSMSRPPISEHAQAEREQYLDRTEDDPRE